MSEFKEKLESARESGDACRSGWSAWCLESFEIILAPRLKGEVAKYGSEASRACDERKEFRKCGGL